MKKTLLIVFTLIFTQLSKAQPGWSAVGTTGINPVVQSLALYNSTLYAGGSFTNTIMKLSGSTWVAVSSPSLIGGSYVYAMSEYNSQLYVGGDFSSAGSVGTDAAKIARWNGTAWSAVGKGANGAVRALTVISGELYAGGSFTAVNNTGGQVANSGCIAKWNSTTSTWSAVGTGIGGTAAQVNAIAYFNNRVYAGGSFTTAGGNSINNIAEFNPLTMSWASFGTLTGTVRALASFNGSLYAGGTFGIKRWSGSAWVDVGTGLSGTVTVLALISFNGSLYVGGYFSAAGGVPNTANIAKWNGTAWFSTNSGLNADVDAFYVDPLSPLTLYAGGTFSSGTAGAYKQVAKYTSAVGIEEENFTSGIRIYPNPASDKITVSAELKTDNAQLRIYDLTGRLLKEQAIINHQSLSIDCSSFSAGIYFVKMNDGNRVFTQKLIIE